MRQLTLEDTPNDLQRGDLLLFPSNNHSYFGVYCGHSKTRKTMNIITLSARYEHPSQVERVKKYGIEILAWKQTGMGAANDKPFSKMVLDSNYLYFVQNYIPYSPELLPPFHKQRYQDICKLLGV